MSWTNYSTMRRMTVLEARGTGHDTLNRLFTFGATRLQGNSSIPSSQS